MKTRHPAWILLPLTLLLLPPLSAQEPPSAAELQELMGEWTLSMEMQGNRVEMTLSFVEEDGRVAAILRSERRPEPQRIEAVSKTESGVRLEWQRDFGGQMATLTMDLVLADGGLSGSFGDDGGFFSAEVTGARSGETVAAADDEQDADRAQRRRRRFGSTVDLTLEGKRIDVAYMELDRNEFPQDYAKLSALAEGEIFQFVGGRALKLKTEASLTFGDQLIERGNAAPNYPGVYSLWLRRVEDGWRLVFNEHADIWGSQHLAAADVAQVPLVRSDSEEDLEKLKVELVEMGEGGLLRLAWGPHQWLAPFELAD